MKTYTREEQLRADMWNVAYDAVHDHRAWQNVPELAEVLYLLASEDPAPRVVVEIGSAWGGTLYAWRQLPGRPAVYGVTQEHFGVPERDHGAVVLAGDSHDRSTLRRLSDQLGRRPVDVLFIDGDHSYAGTLADWRMYSPLVRAGGLVLFHDIRCPGEEAVREVWEQKIRPEVAASGGHTMEIIVKAGKPLGFGIVRTAGERDGNGCG